VLDTIRMRHAVATVLQQSQRLGFEFSLRFGQESDRSRECDRARAREDLGRTRVRGQLSSQAQHLAAILEGVILELETVGAVAQRADHRPSIQLRLEPGPLIFLEGFKSPKEIRFG
jgi:hypothetical protein